MATVKLIDGREVDSASEEWRAETEARTVLSWPKQRRIAYLDGGRDPITGKPTRGVLQHRGPEATQKLKQDILRLWKNRNP